MAKEPAFQFYPADWLRDPELGMASVTSRGIWMDLLSQMWFGADRGCLTGTVQQLSSLVRGCSIEQFETFLVEAEELNFCEVVRIRKDDGKESVRLSNRRMVREEKARRLNAKYQEDHRRKNASKSEVRDDVAEPKNPSSSAVFNLQSAEKELGANAPCPTSPDAPPKTGDEKLKPEDLTEAWNEVATDIGLVTVREISSSRRKKTLLRLHEHPKPQFWTEVFVRLRASPFLRGLKSTNGNGHEKWKASFDWLIENDTNAVKVYEGKYANA